MRAGRFYVYANGVKPLDHFTPIYEFGFRGAGGVIRKRNVCEAA